jgi:hypothetical protein
VGTTGTTTTGNEWAVALGTRLNQPMKCHGGHGVPKMGTRGARAHQPPKMGTPGPLVAKWPVVPIMPVAHW